MQTLCTPFREAMYISKHDRDYVPRVLEAVKRLLGPAKPGKVGTVMIVGTPNLGKTTLVNALTAHAAKSGLLEASRVGQRQVGPLPGVTKSVAGVQVRRRAALDAFQLMQHPP